MKTNHLYHIIALSLGISSPSFVNAMLNVPKDIKVTVKHDLSNLGEELGKAGEDVTSNISTGLEKKVFPHIARMSRGAIASIFNLRNAAQFGTPIAIGIALPLAGIYGSRVFWNVLEKRLLSPKPKILLPGSKYGRWDRIRR